MNWKTVTSAKRKASLGGLSTIWREIGKQLILVDGSKCITKMHVASALGKDGMHHAGGFCWDLRDGLRFH